MIDARKKLASTNMVSLEAELNAKNISQNEKLVITEMLEASRHKSRKGHRYSDEWIVLCLIFHMKSPAAYRILRETNILPCLVGVQLKGNKIITKNLSNFIFTAIVIFERKKIFNVLFCSI